jgi:ubiquinone/menaquinone biosynthesis C-methylase UbiE
MAEPYQDLNQVYYRDYYQFPVRSRWMEQIWADAFGAEYPSGLDHYGYLTKHDLAAITARLPLAPGATLLDIGCGKGGPGLWLGQQLKARLIGVDIIPEALDHARAFQSSFQLDFPAQFEVGEFYRIPLPDQSVDAVMSIDSLWAAPNKIQALMEVKRVMKPGAPFVFTHWDLLAVESVPIFEISGLKFVARKDTPDWKAYQQKVYEGILAHEAELVAEMGTAANMLLYEAKASPPYLDMSVRRIYELVRP